MYVYWFDRTLMCWKASKSSLDTDRKVCVLDRGKEKAATHQSCICVYAC